MPMAARMAMVGVFILGDFSYARIAASNMEGWGKFYKIFSADAGSAAERQTRRSRNQDGRMIWGQNHWIQIILSSNHSASNLITFHTSNVSIPNLRTARRICAQDATNFRTDGPTPPTSNAQHAAIDFRTSGRSSARSMDVGRWTVSPRPVRLSSTKNILAVRGLAGFP